MNSSLLLYSILTILNFLMIFQNLKQKENGLAVFNGFGVGAGFISMVDILTGVVS